MSFDALDNLPATTWTTLADADDCTASSLDDCDVS